MERSATQAEIRQVLQERYPYTRKWYIAMTVEDAVCSGWGAWPCGRCKFVEWSRDWESSHSEPECGHGLPAVYDNFENVCCGSSCWGFRPKPKTEKGYATPEATLAKYGIDFRWAVWMALSLDMDSMYRAMARYRFGDLDQCLDVILEEVDDG